MSTTKIAILQDRINGIKSDVLLNHLPRVKESIIADYFDENQALVVFDHLVRIRVLQEQLRELQT